MACLRLREAVHEKLASPSIPNSGVHGHRQQRISYTWSCDLISLETSSEMAKLFILIDQSQEDAGKTGTTIMHT
jgi:hypothetical protein